MSFNLVKFVINNNDNYNNNNKNRNKNNNYSNRKMITVLKLLVVI